MARNLTDTQRDVMRRLSYGLDVPLDDPDLPSLIRFGFVEITIQGFSATVALTPYGGLIVESIKRLDKE